jgi:hypothetical protein
VHGPVAGRQHHLVALVSAGAAFKNGKLIEGPDGSEGADQQVARHVDPQGLDYSSGHASSTRVVGLDRPQSFRDLGLLTVANLWLFERSRLAALRERPAPSPSSPR